MATIRRIIIEDHVLGDAVLPVRENDFPDRTKHPVWFEWTPFGGVENRRLVAHTTRPWRLGGDVYYDRENPARWGSAHARLDALARIMEAGAPVNVQLPDTGGYALSRWRIMDLRRSAGPSGAGPGGMTRAVRWRMELQPDFDAVTADGAVAIVDEDLGI